MKKYIKWAMAGLITLLLFSRFIIPNPEFEKPTATVLESTEGVLLGARIASDGQWRFPSADSIPLKFQKCILAFEDRYFYYHFGINPASIFRSIKVNIAEGKIVQGGSTITMQVARLLRDGKPRNLYQKIIETFITLHLEVNYSKERILEMYASNAPFGGNVVGLEAASWRYYGRSPFRLSWAEYAALAVLPNAPALIYPGKNHDILKRKRDFLLDKLLEMDVIDEETNQLSKLEPLPGEPQQLPNVAQHALDRVYSKSPGKRAATTIKSNLQRNAQRILNNHVQYLTNNEIYNAAAVLVKVEDGSVLAYVGNANYTKEHDNDVDVVIANRSTGSILKPFLYASALTNGELLPTMLVPDVPTYISGYVPKNYFPSFDGVARANEALYRSLNVPFVRLLQQYGVDRFYNDLKKMKMSSLRFPSSHYGLSLILGGAEAQLLDLASMYSGMARVLKHGGVAYPSSDWFRSNIIESEREQSTKSMKVVSAAAIYHAFNAMKEVTRPVSEDGWQSFSSSRHIAWKTGTSFGNKDAWAVGATPEYVVAVWVGNADGEGRPGLTGVTAAAPLMFELFDQLPGTSWFELPLDDVVEAAVCTKSGYRASQYCEAADTVALPITNKKTPICPYHRLVHLSKDRLWQVNADCALPSEIVNEKWFVLPPMQEWYYKRKSPLYATLPPFREDCMDFDSDPLMEFIYPKNTSKVFIPTQLDGSRGSAIFEVAYRTAGKDLFWHLDGEYLGSTRDFHQMEIDGAKGEHVLVVVDEEGNEMVKVFTILND
ncbi:penicillin-binding protein 1C [Fulvivirga sp.]|uniref:penicillin-binding protein 1C n=1 Tax=Fulvivirga sp. TaxID=1931237 RepID=UPI0032ED144C